MSAGLDAELLDVESTGSDRRAPESEWSARFGRFAVPIVGAIALVAALVMTYVISSGGSRVDTSLDPYFYGDMGRSVARGDGFEGFGVVLDRRGPFFPIFLGGIYFLFGDSDRVAVLFNCFLFAGTAMLVCDLGRRHFNQRAGVIAGIFCAFHPLLLRYTPALHVESILTFLTTLIVWCAYRFYRQPTVLNGAMVGVAAGLAALTKAVVIMFPVIFVLAIFLSVRNAGRRGEPRRQPWVAMAAVLVAMAVTLAPWTIRNYERTGHFVPVTTGAADAFLRGFFFSRWEYATLQEPPYEGAENASNLYLDAVVTDAGAVWMEDDIETDEILQEVARERFFDEPEQVVRKTTVGLFTFWYQLTSLKNSLLVGVFALGAWTLAIVGWRRARAAGIAVWPFLLPVLYLNVVLAALTSVGRYSAPILPALLVVSAFGADSLLTRWSEGRRRVRSAELGGDRADPHPTGALG